MTIVCKFRYPYVMLARAVLCSTIRIRLKPMLIAAYWSFEVVKKHAGRTGEVSKNETLGSKDTSGLYTMDERSRHDRDITIGP